MTQSAQPWRRTALFPLPIVSLALVLFSCRHAPVHQGPSSSDLSGREVAALNALRDEINETYGFHEGWPRINRGPCGRFAKLFHEEWNARFKNKINIVFVMMPEGIDAVGCDHVLVKLPDGSYYDGGGGVMTAQTLLSHFRAGDRIEEMVEFDYDLLDKRSYSLNRSYGLCPNYSDETTAKIIRKHLSRLATGRGGLP